MPEVAEAAGVGTGTLYRYFEHKEALVNEVYRDAKQRLATALLSGAVQPDTSSLDAAESWFGVIWDRLTAFARAEPEAFRFLEMQDHVEYLDDASKQLELSVLAPLLYAGKRLRARTAGIAIEVAIALVWGAFVGLVKAERLGYLKLDDARLAAARSACWRILAPEPRPEAPTRRKR